MGLNSNDYLAEGGGIDTVYIFLVVARSGIFKHDAPWNVDFELENSRLPSRSTRFEIGQKRSFIYIGQMAY